VAGVFDVWGESPRIARGGARPEWTEWLWMTCRS